MMKTTNGFTQQDPEQFQIMFEAEVAKVAARITKNLLKQK